MSSPAVNGGMARPSNSDGSGAQVFQFDSGAAARRHESSDGAVVALGMSSVPRPGNSPRPEASTNGGDWRHFTPQSEVLPIA
jgi:hypothetical protein